MRFKTTKRVIKLEVWWSDSKCVKVTTKIVLASILLEFIPNFANVVMDWGIWPEYTLCMNKEHQDNEQTLHKTVTWLFWDAIAILYVIQVICVIIWDYRSFRLVQKWVDAQDKYLVHNLSADELHLKNEPHMKSTIINALALFFLCINGAITSSLIDTLTIDDVSLFYQTSHLIFLPLVLVWNHEVTQRTNSEHEKELRRRRVYDEAKTRRAEIEAKRVQRAQEHTFEMERMERYKVSALKGEYGMYGADDSDDQEDKASLEFHDICGFQNIELKNPDHFLWI